MVSCTLKEVAEHSSRDDCWIVLHGQVFDVTRFLPLHPGGADVILAVAGTDASDDFDAVHPRDKLKKLEDNPTISLKGPVTDLSHGIPTSKSPSRALFASLHIHGLLLALLCAFRVANRLVVHGLCIIAFISVIAFTGCELTFKTVFVSFWLTFVNVGVSMSICLHRYFSHGAFSTSRSFQVVLAITSCFAGQGGPLWWASKHNRHHAHCDMPNDPHSAKRHGTLYALFGWFYSPREVGVDTAYIKRFSKFPELFIINELWFVPPSVVVLVAHRWWGLHYTVAFVTHPMFMAWIVSSWFNIEYHPANASAEPDDQACLAVDRVRLLSEFVGESYHQDHHDYPQKALRPGLDLPGRLIIQPLLRAGLIWLDPAEHGLAKEHAH